MKINKENVEFWFEIAISEEPLSAYKQFAIVRRTQELPESMPVELRYEVLKSHRYIVVATSVKASDIWVEKLMDFLQKEFGKP